MGLVIVGGGAAGLAAARGYRDAGGKGAVVMLAAEHDPPYMRPALSKEFLREETEDIALEASDLDVELRLGAEATALDPAARTVTASGETLSYDACVLAMGAEPARLPVPGAERAMMLRSLESARELRGRAARCAAATVIGSGFIGCETAASLAMQGLRVTMRSDEPVPQLARLGEQAGWRIAGWLAELGVALQLGDAVEEIPAMSELELVLMAAGVRPRADLAIAAGLDTEQGRVVTDERMRTSADGVYAAGDVALARNATADRRLPVEHWGEALDQGEAAGRNAAGEQMAWTAAPGFWSTIGGQGAQVRGLGRRLRRDALRQPRWRRVHGLVRTRWDYRWRAHPRRRRGLQQGRQLIEHGRPLP